MDTRAAPAPCQHPLLPVEALPPAVIYFPTPSKRWLSNRPYSCPSDTKVQALCAKVGVSERHAVVLMHKLGLNYRFSGA